MAPCLMFHSRASDGDGSVATYANDQQQQQQQQQQRQQHIQLQITIKIAITINKKADLNAVEPDRRVIVGGNAHHQRAFATELYLQYNTKQKQSGQ
jgi:hypothetical protein